MDRKILKLFNWQISLPEFGLNSSNSIFDLLTHRRQDTSNEFIKFCSNTFHDGRYYPGQSE